MKKILSIIIILGIALVILTGCIKKDPEIKEFKIVTSFYPMYTIANKLTENIDGVVVENMANNNVGCLHDYTLTTADLKKIENANVFVYNGLGIENFTQKILQTYQKIRIIDSSENINGLISDENENNAHIWLDIDKYTIQVENVKNGLIKADNEHKEKYEKNAQDYLNKLNELKEKLKDLKEKKCLSFSESLAYLEKSMNLKIKTIETDHEQNGLSAETLAEAIKYVKDNNIKNIIIDKQTADNNAKTVANETGAKVYVLDSMLGGGDGYIEIMEENFKIVESME